MITMMMVIVKQEGNSLGVTADAPPKVVQKLMLPQK